MKVLFVCTGNTCRSPMAEGLLRRLAADRKLKLELRSAGVAAMPGAPMSRHTEAILRREGAELPGGGARPIDGSAVEWADLILTMTVSHKRALLGQFPYAVDKVFALKEYTADPEAEGELRQLLSEAELDAALGKPGDESVRRRIRELEHSLPSFDVADPFGGPLAEYERTAAELRVELLKLVEKLERLRYNTDT